MLTRLTDWVLGREPVVTATGLAGLVTAAFGLLHAFDVLRLTPEQVAAVGTFLAVAAGWAARRVVSPVLGQTERQVVRLSEKINNEAGGVFAVICIACAVVFLLLFGFCLTLGDGEQQSMARTEDNRPCQGDNACQGRQKRGCAEATAPCSDDDKVTVIVCAQPDSCRFEGEPA